MNETHKIWKDVWNYFGYGIVDLDASSYEIAEDTASGDYVFGWYAFQVRHTYKINLEIGDRTGMRAVGWADAAGEDCLNEDLDRLNYLGEANPNMQEEYNDNAEI